MSRNRERVAHRMLTEIHEHLGKILPAGTGVRAEVWEAMVDPDRELAAAMAAWERGEVALAELEEAGTRYVEAWDAAASSG